jgi:sensor histidine kinase YesM
MRKAGLVLAVNTAGGLIPAAVLSLFNLEGGIRFFYAVLFDSMVFSCCIGSLIFGAMHYLGPRYDQLSSGLHWAAETLTFAALAIIGSLIATTILMHVPSQIGGAMGWPFGPIFFRSLRIAIAMTLVMGALVSYLLMQSGRLRSTTLDLRTRQLEEERARKLAAEARLSSLESRIHPHFLFNSLNSITALIREDPAGAERMMERLAGLLRYSLDANSAALVPLAQELRLVRDYLDIEKTRFGDRLRFSVDAGEQICDRMVPPLALQTLVENSIKHSISNRREGGEIRVIARVEGDAVVLDVSDDGPGFESSAMRPDHGLHNLQGRLDALFGALGRLDVTRHDGRTVVSVRVPQKLVPV